jgi:hypothetical protein
MINSPNSSEVGSTELVQFMASIAVLHVQEPLTGLFGLAALVGTGEHFNKRSPLLDQSRSRLFEIVGMHSAHNCLSRPIPGLALGRNN